MSIGLLFRLGTSDVLVFVFLVVRRLPSLNLAMNPLKPGPELKGVGGAGETRDSIVTVVADIADNDSLRKGETSSPEMQSNPVVCSVSE